MNLSPTLMLGWCPTCEVWFLGLKPQRMMHGHKVLTMDNSGAAGLLSFGEWEQLSHDIISRRLQREGLPKANNKAMVLPWPVQGVKP